MATKEDLHLGFLGLKEEIEDNARGSVSFPGMKDKKIKRGIVSRR